MFKSARLKLTAWYLTIIMVVSLMFSLVIFQAVSREIDRLETRERLRIQQQVIQQVLPFPPPPGGGAVRILIEKNPQLLKEVRARLLFALGLINGGILIISGALGYWLAGRTLKPIQVMVDEQNRFITDASHELKTPLTSLKAAFEVYLRGQKKKTETDIIIQESLIEVNKMQALSESLLTLAQFQKPNSRLLFQRVDLLLLAKQAAKKINSQARLKKIKLEVQGTGALVKGNQESLEELLTILLDNAIKYSFQNRKVKIKIHEASKLAELQVIDEGVGISSEDLPKIFNRFYRADVARQKVGKNGYGLGLSIAREIVKMHKGKIRVVSEEGKGTTFIINLPLFS